MLLLGLVLILEQGVEVVHIGLMVLSVVILHEGLRNDWLKGVKGIREGFDDNSLRESSGNCVSKH